MGLNHLQSLICTYGADDLRPLMFHIQLRSLTVSFAEQSSTDLTRGIVGLVMGFLMGIVAVLLVLLFIWWKRKQKVTTELPQLDHRL